MQFGTNTPSIRKQRLYYTETSTIYEGMPICYEFNATTNVLGYSKSEGGEDARNQTTKTTTAEGYLNEGKFLRVEDPDAGNIMWFAGVVCAGGYVGKAGPKWVDVYEPNGAIVPVRAGVACTVGRTVLSVITATQYLGAPLSGTQAYPVAVAEETNSALTTPGLILARLDRNMFIHQDNTGDALLTGVGTADVILNRINVSSAQTAGLFTAFQVDATSSAGASSEGSALAGNFNAWISGTPAGKVNAVGIWTNITGGTVANNICGLEVGIWTDQSLASAGWVAPLCIRDELQTGPSANSHFMIQFICDGTGDHPDGLFCAQAAADIAMTSAASVTVGAKIAFKVGTPGAYTTYYIPCGTTTS